MSDVTPKQVPPAAVAKLNEGVAFHQQGRLAEAKAAYTQAIALEGTLADAWHLLGVLAAQSGQAQDAADLIAKAIAFNPHAPAFHFNLGNALRELQRPGEALAAYDRSIALEPRDPATHYSRGLVLQALGRFGDALGSFDSAIARNPGDPTFHFARGLVLYETKQYEAAVAASDQVIALLPSAGGAYLARARALQKCGRFDAALVDYDKCVALQPGDAVAWALRGVMLHDRQRFADAVASFDRALELQPQFPEALVNRATSLIALKQLDRAMVDCDRAVAMRHDYADAYAVRGIVLQEQNQLDAALGMYEKAIALKPDLVQAHVNRGAALIDLMRLDDALTSLDRALAHEPDHAEALINRGFVLQTLRRMDEALASFNAALTHDPHHAGARLRLGMAHLMNGDFESGWELYEARWQDKRIGLVPRPFAAPLWLGKESIAGKTILLHGEQGLGDMLQFCRYAKPVADLGARVILEVPAQLMSLLTSLEGVSEIVALGTPLPPFDVHCPLMSLPLALKARLSTIPGRAPYIVPESKRVADWAEKLAVLAPGPKSRIGLVWSGGFRADQPGTWKVNARRNIALQKLAPLRALNASFISLQKGQPGEAELVDAVRQGWDGPTIIDVSGHLQDFADTAALIANLDLVLSVDTSTAHLAGAIGKPVWMLSRYDNCWRWQVDRADTPWYPTMRIYQQRTPGDWDEVIVRVRTDLADYLARSPH